MRALLIGKEPPCDLGCSYVKEGYDGVVIGSMSLSEALGGCREEVLQALATGLTVIAYEPGFPGSPGNRALGASLASAKRQMKNWGIRFVAGGEKKLITAEVARALRSEGRAPAPGAVLTPLAREILNNGQWIIDN